MKAARIFTALAFLFGITLAIADGQGNRNDDEGAKVAVAKLRIRVIDEALKAYRVKTGDYPEELKTLTEGTNPILEGKALIGPWGKPYKYDVTGPKNNGRKPDVWVETSGKKIIGNWEDAKKPK
jgi:hypothetical protein